MKYILIFILFFSFQVFASEVSYQVPSSWLTAEEETYQIFGQSPQATDEKFNQGTDKILQTVLNPLKQSANEKSWKLNGVMFDLTVSSQGTLGLLAMKGAPSATIAWIKKPKTKPAVVSQEEGPDSGYAININENVDRSTDSLVKTLMSTGQVKNEAHLRENLTRVVSSFKNLTNGIETTSQTQWSLSRLRLDLSVGASGDLSPFTTVGGALRVRLEWFPQKRSQKIQPNEAQKNMNNFFNTMVHNLSNWNGQNQLLEQGLELARIRVGIGLTSRFNVGLVRSSVGTAFHVYFEKKKMTYQIQTIHQPTPSQAFHQFAEESLDDINQNWNSILQISSSKMLTSKPAIKDKLYVVEPEQFYKGLSKSAKIGKYFVQRSKKNLANSEWTLQQVKIGTEISLTGALSLATLTGATSCEMTFQPL